MSVESAKAFLKKYASEPDFKKKIEETASDEERQKIVKEAGFYFTKDEIKEMIRRRIQSVGGVDFEPFSEEAVELIADHSQGAPREALKICSSAIIKAITTKKTVIDVSLVEEVISRRPSEILNKIKSLGRREKEVMRLFISRPTITNQDVRSELNISSQAAYNILARLMEKELIEPIQSGEGKGNEYAPKELVKRVLTPDIAERILAT